MPRGKRQRRYAPTRQTGAGAVPRAFAGHNPLSPMADSTEGCSIGRAPFYGRF